MLFALRIITTHIWQPQARSSLYFWSLHVTTGRGTCAAERMSTIVKHHTTWPNRDVHLLRVPISRHVSKNIAPEHRELFLDKNRRRQPWHRNLFILSCRTNDHLCACSFLVQDWHRNCPHGNVQCMHNSIIVVSGDRCPVSMVSRVVSCRYNAEYVSPNRVVKNERGFGAHV